MSDYDDMVSRLRELGEDELAETAEKYSASSLRKKAAERDSLEQERDDFKAKYESLVLVPKKEQAFKDMGVDLEALRPAERSLIRDLRVEGEEISKDRVAQIIEEYGLPIRDDAGEGSTEETPEAAKIAQAARSAPQGGNRPAGTTTISPEEAREWSTEKFLRFKAKFPEQFENLKRGETITGVAFS